KGGTVGHVAERQTTEPLQLPVLSARGGGTGKDACRRKRRGQNPSHDRAPASTRTTTDRGCASTLAGIGTRRTATTMPRDRAAISACFLAVASGVRLSRP